MNQPQSPNKVPQPPRKTIAMSLVPLIVFTFVTAMFIYLSLNEEDRATEKLNFSQFIQTVESGKIKSVLYDPATLAISGEYNEPNENRQKKYSSIGILSQEIYLKKLEAKNLTPNIKAPESRSTLGTIISISFQVLIIYLLYKMFFGGGLKGTGGAGGMGAIGGFMKAKFKEGSENSNVSFDDVAGIDEAKEELKEIVDFLKNSEKYTRLGAKTPKGALLVGPPGTGKTMLAKAVAKEANAKFLTISGSDFVEMFVGVGASRVRDIFKEAKEKQPCIIFIDEIDAIGKSRDQKGGFGGNDEKEQTLNQLLVEMDGFSTSASVIVLAATNRMEILDKALLRPGRFDRTVHVSLPDIMGREKILEVHGKKVKLEANISLKKIAQGTAGFSGADLANLINEAAISAAKSGADHVTLHDLEHAKDKVMMGPERKSLVMSDKEKRTTAYHEAGHALISMSIPELDKVHKVSIIPRGRALGVTQTISEENELSLSFTKSISMIAMLMGGKIAEEVVFQHKTTGASNDIERATMLARRMVCEWGMSDKLGSVNLNKEHNGLISSYDLSESTKVAIDAEVKAFIDMGIDLARKTLTDKRELLNKISERLIERETLDAAEIVELMKEDKAEEV